MHCKPAPLQLSQDLGCYRNLLRQDLLCKVKDLYMAGESEPSAHMQGKGNSVRVWLCTSNGGLLVSETRELSSQV